ncbi:MAG: RsbRD N-terminal domain-containing protein, partial [Gemmatimonadetes bacterium]|nr:RsbRD N-terminal domain-containing protein [Gemmatimonadota bacterium]
IVGYTELLDLELQGPLSEGQRTYVSKVRSSSQHLLGLVNDVLDLSKVEAGEMTVLRERVPLRGTATNALAMIVPQAEVKGVDAEEASACPPAAAYYGDEDRVRQILVNLLSNAVKFTEPGGRVSIRCEVSPRPASDARLEGSGPWVCVEVEDTGIGIAPEQVSRVFQPFVQVDDAHTRREGGTGLGLTISRRFARLMGGDLTVRSRLGEGSVFTLWLPAAAATPAEEPAEPRDAWPSQPGEVPGLAGVGHLLARRADEVVRGWGEVLCTDPRVPTAHGMNRAQLENHVVTFLVEIGKALITLDEGGGEPALMQDGESIQRTIARLHGDQRARLGFAADEVSREFHLLREAVEDRVRREVPGPTDADPGTALGIVRRLLERAERITLESHARSLQESAT